MSTLSFDGATATAEDTVRLTGQYARVFGVMRDAQWRTLPAIQDDILVAFEHYDSQTGISARLRDFRKERFGSHTVNSRKFSGGLWEYQLVVEPQQGELF